MALTINVRLKDKVEVFTKRLYYFMFDEQAEDSQFLEEKFLEITTALGVNDTAQIWNDFNSSLPSIREKLHLDAKAFQNNDPANKCVEEIYLAYPGFYAISIHRLSHQLLKLGVRILPRMMSEYVHGITGIDIHPGATIGDSFFLDHGTGIVIGETTIIKDEVKIYQGVTLGGLHVLKSLADTKRHPTIEKNVVIYANATVLGDIVIGSNTIIGANVCVTENVPKNSTLTYKKEYKIRTKSE
ncbi:serine O-acetyltransferase EpsC [Mesoflavibacter sp.]|uniref:serine O-acetyltransferase EpsC n=1 Tax=Mesoflavibacter sp. TaxID=1930902 RepID=UPI0035127B21